MLDQFDAEMSKIDLTAATERRYDVADIVKIASIIERDVRIAEERPLVSSVIHNRLSRNMKLEIGATMDYALSNTHRPLLAEEQMRVESPFNTFIHEGLPPGPISNPGLASLQAAADPADTAYLYRILIGEKGTHTFASSEEEFLMAKQLSERLLGEQPR